MIHGDAPIVFGDGGQTRDFVFVQDVVDANLLAVQAKAAPGHVYNIASGRSVTILEIVHAIAERLGIDSTINYQPERDGDIRDSLADVRLASRDLGFHAQTLLTDGLTQTIGAVAIASAA